HVKQTLIVGGHNRLDETEPLHNRGAAEIFDQHVGTCDQLAGTREPICDLEINHDPKFGEIVADECGTHPANQRCGPTHEIAFGRLDLDYGCSQHAEPFRRYRSDCSLPKVEHQKSPQGTGRVIE